MNLGELVELYFCLEFHYKDLTALKIASVLLC